MVDGLGLERACQELSERDEQDFGLVSNIRSFIYTFTMFMRIE